ncbi:MAG TPA: SRPBCC family protein [Deltaproteobacteria bacterium]|nr:SRPBCC family protein [Deltaproteobacteria bacterium]
MAKIYRKIDIHAPVEKVYRYLDDPENLHSWMQNVVVVKNVRGTGDGTRYTVLENMAGVPVRGEFEVIEDLPNDQIVLKSRGDIESLWSFRFEHHPGDVTTLDLDVDYRVPALVLEKVPEQDIIRRNERDLDASLHYLRERLELMYSNMKA